MFFAIVGLAMLLLKALSVGFMADVSWWLCLLPFVFAFVYWEFIDPALQITAKREMRNQLRKEVAQRRKHAEEMFSEDHWLQGKKRNRK